MKSAAENAFAKLLTLAGYPFKREYRFHPTRLWRSDFYIPPLELLIEIEGIGYARGKTGRHQTGTGFEADAVKYNAMVALGYRLMRFTPNMVYGKAKQRGKYLPTAIDTLDEWVMGDGFDTADRSKSGYIVQWLPDVN